MPTYTVTDPQTQRRVTLKGDSPPSEAELTEIFSKLAPLRTDVPADVALQLADLPNQKGAPDAILSNVKAGVSAWSDAGPHRVVEGLKDMRAGNVARGARDVIRGGLVTAAPMVAPMAGAAIVAAPTAAFGAAALGTVVGGGAALLTDAGGKAMGLSDDQAGLASDVAGLAAGGYAGKWGARGGAAVAQRAKDVAAGASEEGLGGALAAAVRHTAPSTPTQLATQALKPTAANLRFEQDIEQRALPDIKRAELASGKPITGLEDFKTTTLAAKRDNRAEFDALAGPMRGAWSRVDLNPVADGMIASIPSKTKLENPSAVARVLKRAALYRRPFTVEETESLLRDTNAKLEGFYAKYPTSQRAAVRAMPDVAETVAQATELRTALYKTLDAPGQGAAARELQQRYGALMDVEHEIERRWNVFKRQQPESLSEQIGAVRAAGQVARGAVKLIGGNPVSAAADFASAAGGRAVSKALKEFQTTDTLLRRAMRGVAPSAPVPPPARPTIAGLLPPGAVRGGPGADPSFARGVPAMPAQSTRLALPAGRPPVTAPPVPDASFVRGVPAEYARHEVRGLLPSAQPPTPPQRVFHLSGDAPVSGGKLVPAAVLTRDIDPSLPAKQAMRVRQYSSDPSAVDAPMVNDQERAMLQRMKVDLQELAPQKGKYVHGEMTRGAAGEESHYAHGSAGTPIAEDLRVLTGEHISNGQIHKAITDVLAGKPITRRLHAAVIDAARGYIEQRPGYRGPVLPEGATTGPRKSVLDDFDAFSKMVDELSKGH